MMGFGEKRKNASHVQKWRRKERIEGGRWETGEEWKNEKCRVV